MHKKSCLGSLICVKNIKGASLVGQWLRIRLPMQGTQIESLIKEDPLASGQSEAQVPRAGALQRQKPRQWDACPPQPERSPRLPQLAKARARKGTPGTARNKYTLKRENVKGPEGRVPTESLRNSAHQHIVFLLPLFLVQPQPLVEVLLLTSFTFYQSNQPLIHR